MSNNKLTVDAQDLADTARFLLYGCGYSLGGNRTIFEMVGAATAVLVAVAQEIQDTQKDEQQTDLSQVEGGEGITVGPTQIQETGTDGGTEESSQGTSEATPGKA